MFCCFASSRTGAPQFDAVAEWLPDLARSAQTRSDAGKTRLDVFVRNTWTGPRLLASPPAIGSHDG
eukprot:7839802-Pyramimonas_sp.AAC.1